MKKRKNTLFILAVISVLMNLKSAYGLLPTIDTGAIAEGVKSNIEKVKQSKVIMDATTLAGKVNSTIGNAKASLSELGVEEAQKVAERIQKEKENLEKAKQEYDKYKQEIEEKKEKLEAAKAEAEKYKEEVSSKVQDFTSEVQSGISEAKGAMNEVQSGVSETKGMMNEVQSKVSKVQNLAEEKKQEPSKILPEMTQDNNNQVEPERSSMQAIENTSDSIVVKSKIENLETQIAELQAQLKAKEEMSQANGINTVNPNATIALKREIGSLEAQIAELQAQLKAKEEMTQTSNTKDGDVEEELQNKVPQTLKENTSEIEEELKKSRLTNEGITSDNNTPNKEKVNETISNKPFRQSPKINVNDNFYEKQSRKEPRSEEDKIYYAQVARDDILYFAEVTDDLLDTPTGRNSQTDEFIFSDKLARHCNLNVNNLEDKTATEECIKELIKERSDSNNQIAMEGNQRYTEIMQETASALLAEAMYEKNEASNYEKEVLTKTNEDLASASTIRDDINGLSQTNKQTQILLNKILKIYSSQILLDSMDGISKYSAQYIEEGEE